MKEVRLFEFQHNAVNELRDIIDMAHAAWDIKHNQQVISFSAPTGSGKTIIMTQLFEQILFGDADHEADPNACFLWLSDSPELNEQTRLKIENKSDMIKANQLVDVDQSFAENELEGGKIYFINTQKLGSGKQLVTLSDQRTDTFWTIVENTANKYPKHFYLVIDEAHRGTKTDREAKVAQSIMQKFIYGSMEDGITALPLVIGLSATARRFEKMIISTQSTLNRVTVSAAQVRESGLLKDDVILNYPDMRFTPDMAMMEAAASDWAVKRYFWFVHNKNNSEPFIEPILIVQVEDGDAQNPTVTDLGQCLKIIEERAGIKLQAGEVAHTFNGFGELNANGIPIYYVDPSHIQENMNIRVVFFKMNLSTGWDCPRAETIMSFRHATDATYIAQLLGRMVRTPMAKRIPDNEVLNNVELFLPHFDDDTVKEVIAALRDSDSDGLTVTNITTAKQTKIYYAEDPEPAEEQEPQQPTELGNAQPLSSNQEEQCKEESTSHDHQQSPIDSNPIVGDHFGDNQEEVTEEDIPADPRTLTKPVGSVHQENDSDISTGASKFIATSLAEEKPVFVPVNTIRRKEIIKAVRDANLTSYSITLHRKRSFLKSLFLLARILSRSKIFTEATEVATDMVLDEIHQFIEGMKKEGVYTESANKYREFELKSTVIDAFGEKNEDLKSKRKMLTTDADIEKQYYLACGKLGEGLGNSYLKKYANIDDIATSELEVIVFANNLAGMTELETKAESMFNNIYRKFRPAVVSSNNRSLISDINDISGLSSEAAPIIYSLPDSADFPESGKGKVYADHLYCEGGLIRIDLNTWEAGVITEEEKRSDFVCWLRNVERKEWSLCIPYRMDGSIHSAYPDMMVFRKHGLSDYIIDILEPHLPSDKDNVYKAIGFAEYAEENQNSILGRLELIRMEKAGDGRDHFKRLDVNDIAVRKMVMKITTNAELDNLFEQYGYFEN